ncbi:MAG: glycosyltransferase [Bacteroidaceae bacterium]|nr:glycosyltransferase [Bacteroidaceae bacterium]
MKVLLVSTSDMVGGGAIAAFRLMEALNNNGVKAKMLVRDKLSSSVTVAQTGTIIPKVLERLQIMSYLKGKLWQADTADFGIDITRTEEYKEADIIHLHWINQGMVSLSCLKKMIKDGKKIVWTLHDEWPYLGICHYRGDCQETECRQCPLLPGNIAHKHYLQKQNIYKKGNITFVGCSQWITDRAKQAMPDAEVVHINNCVPHDIFRHIDQTEARKKLNLPLDNKIILFCSQNLNDERKGFAFLQQALEKFTIHNSQFIIQGPQSMAMDSHSPKGGEGGGLMTICIGKGGRYISSPEEMAMMYAAADVFVTPSLQDNLPNTIAEAMSCGTPCVGFNVGGIPEMIDHLQNGYVAQYKDVNDLAEGIQYVLTHDMREAALHKAASAYGETHVAQKYINVYESR